MTTTTHRPLLAVLCTLASLLALPKTALADDNKPVPINEKLAAKGETVYTRFCVSCHGQLGDGRGYSAQWLEPRPRDFTSGIFKCRSTPSGTLPTNDDLLRTLKVGPVPHVHALLEHHRGAAASRGHRVPEDVLAEVEGRGAGHAIVIPPEPPNDEASQKRGRVIWKNNQCEKCHGPEGKGNGASAPTLRDDWGFPDQPFNFASSDKRKCGSTNADLYRTFMTGVNGSPMPSFGEASVRRTAGTWCTTCSLCRRHPIPSTPSRNTSNERAGARPSISRLAARPTVRNVRPAKMAMWIFLLSDWFSFAGLLLGYGILRAESRCGTTPGSPRSTSRLQRC